MNTKYFEKVENKYIFNVSLIFWHIFIALSTLAIAASILVFLWSIIPAMEKNVEKQAYPEKKQYPAPVKVALTDLKLEEVKKEEAPPPVSQKEIETPVAKQTQQIFEDTRGKVEYEVALKMLKTYIPPTKYSWSGNGYWSYPDPNGERLWKYYKSEKYRQWNPTEPGTEDKLKYALNYANANNYIDKKKILDSYVAVVKVLSEAKRLKVLEILMSNVASSVSMNSSVCNSVARIVKKMATEDNVSYLEDVVRFGKNNLKDGTLTLDYLASIIDKFDATQRVTIIDYFIKSYYSYFNQNYANHKEATDLFLPMIAHIKSDQQPKALMQYYGIYLEKNRERDNEIARIEIQHQQSIKEIDNQYILDQANAQAEYMQKQKLQEEFRKKSLMGIAGGIVLIVLIASILVFLSIQRSVKRIEEKLLANENSKL